MAARGLKQGRAFRRSGFNLRAALLLTLVLSIALALVAVPAFAHVKDWYEWKVDPTTGKPQRTLKVWVDPAGGTQLQEWTQQAMDNWNNAGTGWTLQPTSQIEGADVTIHSAPIPNNPDGSDPVGRCYSDFDGNTGEVIGATIILDSTENWGTSGDETLDPVKTLKHELGHAMRLGHSELGNLMADTITIGDHDLAPNLDDIDEAKQAATSTRPIPEPRSEAGRIAVGSGSADLTIGALDYEWIGTELGFPVTVDPMEGVMLPDPLAVPENLERVVVAAGIFPSCAEFLEPAELRLTWDQGAVHGLQTAGELHRHPQPPLDPEGMVPVYWVADPTEPGTGTWAEAALDLVLGAENGTATLGAFGGGIYGLAAPAEDRPPAEGVAAFSDLSPSTDALVAQALTELRAMDVYRGYTDGTAQPGRNLTRLEFCTVAVRLAGGEEAAELLDAVRPDFTDAIPEWGWGYVNQAATMGLVQGYPDGTFQPLNDVTGNEAITVLVRVLGPECEGAALDAPWPQGYRDVATELGLLDELAELVEGGLGGWLSGYISRGEMAVVTRAAAWVQRRYTDEGLVVESSSIAARRGWWRATAQLSAASSDGRRWALRRSVDIPGSGKVDRLEVDRHPYLCPGAALPQAGQAAAVFGTGRTVLAITSVIESPEEGACGDRQHTGGHAAGLRAEEVRDASAYTYGT